MKKKSFLDFYELTEKITNHIDTLRSFEKLIFSNKKFDIKDTVLISGSPRSGTSWLLDLIKKSNNYSWIFEPIQPTWYPESFEIGFNSRTYLPENVDWKEGENYLKDVFLGKIYCKIPPYTFNISENMHRLFGKKLLVKTVRLNRMLPWIQKRFQLKGIILIIRHPCAVIASQINSGFIGYHPSFPPYKNIFPTHKDILNEISKMDFLEEKVVNKLKRIQTTEEILAATWCLDNIIPLSVKKPYTFDIIFYEELVKDCKKAIEGLNKKYGNKNIIKPSVKGLNKPSVVASREFNVALNTDKQLTKWKNVLSENKIKKIYEIVSIFNLDLYNKNEPNHDII